MILCITGATGFIGSKLATLNLINFAEIRYLTRHNSKPIDGAIPTLGNVNADSTVLQPFLDQCSLLINCAAELKDPNKMHETHVMGTKNLLHVIEVCHKNSHETFHWIQLSSCGAYGQNSEKNHLPRYVDEETPNNPDGEYEVTKTEADDLITDFARKHDWFKYTIIRPTIVFGHGMKSSLILRIANMVKKSLFFYIGHKDAIVNFVHVDDLVEAMHLAMMNEAAYNQTFIISNDCRLEDFICTISKTLNKNSPRLIINERLIRACVRFANKCFKLPINESQIDVLTRRTYYSNHKITHLLNWTPKKHILLQLEEFMLDHSK